MTEAQLHSLLKKNIEGHWCRVENTIGAGMPDVNVVHNGIEIWIELKIIKGNYLLFEWSQINWFNCRQLNGMENIYVVARNADKIMIIKAADIKKEMVKKKASKAGVRIDDDLIHQNFYKPWDWDEIATSLFY